MSSRIDYENMFLQHGISRNELYMMTNAEYQRTLNYFLQNPVSSEYIGNNYSGDTQYRYVSSKIAAENQRRMKNSRKEPLIAKTTGMDSAYASKNGQNFCYNFNQQQSQPPMQNDLDYSQFQQYDEDEALQMAMMASMQEQLNSSQQDQQCFEQQNNHSEPDFTSKTQNSENSNMPSSSSYSYIYKETPQNARVPQNEDQKVFDEQTAEYNKCCEEAFQKEMENNSAQHYEDNQRQIEQFEHENRIGEVVSKYYSLKPEPQTGTTIGVFIHNERLMRKFDPNEMGENVYTWVAGQTINDQDDEKLFFDNFELQVPGMGLLDPHQTLAGQGIKGRVMVIVNKL